jgi:hypothetical protein
MTRSKVLNQNISAKSFQCNAKDIGLTDYLICLEDSRERLMCAHRFSFGFDFLCDNPERIEQMRSGK